jgi:hypothetical protein
MTNEHRSSKVANLMALVTRARLGPYEILGPLGASDRTASSVTAVLEGR